MFKGYKLWIFKGYVAINKRGAEKIIDEIYATLPDDINKAREFLKNKNGISSANQNPKIYEILRFLEDLLDKNCLVAPYTLVDKKEFEKLKEQLKDSIPEEIYEANKINK